MNGRRVGGDEGERERERRVLQKKNERREIEVDSNKEDEKGDRVGDEIEVGRARTWFKKRD